jgi:hypothetical protein
VTGETVFFNIADVTYQFDGAAAGSGAKSYTTVALHAGDHAFQAFFAGNSDYNVATSELEPFVVDKGTVTLATTIYNAASDTVIPLNSHVALGTSAYDKVTVTGETVFFNIADVTYQFNGAASGSGAKSTTQGPLSAGNYAFRAFFAGNDDYNAATSDPEPFVVDKALTIIATQVHDTADKDITNTVVYVGIIVHDSATVSGQVGTIAITGQVKYTFYNNAACTGTPTKTETVTIGTESTPQTINSIGYYCYKAEYLGDGNYTSSVSPIEPFTVVQHSMFTDTMLCTLPSDTFKLVLTPDQQNQGLYKLNASNPGQFYYNMFYTGAGNEDITVTIPYPWVTQGAVPIHVYSSVLITGSNGSYCLSPSGELANAGTQVTMQTYDGINSPPYSYDFTKSTEITIHVPATTNGFAYINIHLDYGLKGTTGYQKNGATNAAELYPELIKKITDLKQYAFSDDTNGTVNITSTNTFKRDPGIGGLVLDQYGDPVVGATIVIKQGTKVMYTGTTDEDGWYMWQYKWVGKRVTMTIYVTPPGNKYDPVAPINVELKSNGYVVVDFIVHKK